MWVSLSPLSSQVQILGGLSLLSALAVAWLAHRRSRSEWWLPGLRTLAGLCILGMLLEPALQRRQVRRIPDRVAVVLDDSLSMSLPAGDTTSRYDLATTWIEAAQTAFDELGNRHTIEWYNVAGRRLDAATVPSEAKATDSDLGRGIEGALVGDSKRPLAGLILISDGADRHGLWRPKQGFRQDFVAQLEASRAPIFPLSAHSYSMVDSAIASVSSEEFAFVENTVDIDVLIDHVGAEGQTATLTLFAGDRPLESRRLSHGPKPQQIALSLKPTETGEFLYRLELSALEGERVLRNNSHQFVLNVIRDKIRVLQVAGRPSWDERFLRPTPQREPQP